MNLFLVEDLEDTGKAIKTYSIIQIFTDVLFNFNLYTGDTITQVIQLYTGDTIHTVAGIITPYNINI